MKECDELAHQLQRRQRRKEYGTSTAAPALAEDYIKEDFVIIKTGPFETKRWNKTILFLFGVYIQPGECSAYYFFLSIKTR